MNQIYVRIFKFKSLQVSYSDDGNNNMGCGCDVIYPSSMFMDLITYIITIAFVF